MRKKIFLLVLTSILFLAGCETNRFHSKTMDDYLHENDIQNIHFSESNKLSTYGWELYIQNGDENNLYNQETEAMDWALGENLVGELVLIYVPLNSKYDIVIEQSPYPDVDSILIAVENYNSSSPKICEVQIELPGGRYQEFKSLYETEFISNNFFNDLSISSSYYVEIGTCIVDDSTYDISLININQNVHLIAYETLSIYEPQEVTVLDLFVLD